MSDVLPSPPLRQDAAEHGPTPLARRYRAFISYCHEDRKSAGRLQNALENFRLPRGTSGGKDLPGHLRPIFRDRDVLGSSHDLSAAIRAALDDSEYLIVVCSPQAAASRWVAAEIRYFSDRHGAERILCFVVDGAPNSSDPARECLPEPLRRAQSGREVLAADARKEGDGWRDAVLKIVAGLTGLPFAELARREQRIMRRRALLWVSSGILLATIFGVLAAYSAYNAAAARKSARSAELIAGYLEEVLSQFSPRDDQNAARAALLPLIDASTRSDRLDTLKDEPMALLRVRHILGRAYLELNAADRALPLLEANADLATELLGPDSPHTRSALRLLGNTFNAIGQHERGAEIHRQLLDRAIALHGEKSEDALAAMTNLAFSLMRAGHAEEAAALHTRVYEIGRQIFPADHTSFQEARRNYAIVLSDQGRLDELVAFLQELHRDQTQSPGPDYLGTLETSSFLGEALEASGDLEGAAAAYARAAEGLAKILGPDESRSIFCAFRLAHVLAELGRKDEASGVVKKYFGRPPDARRLGIIGKKPSDLPR